MRALPGSFVQAVLLGSNHFGTSDKKRNGTGVPNFKRLTKKKRTGVSISEDCFGVTGQLRAQLTSLWKVGSGHTQQSVCTRQRLKGKPSLRC